MAKNDGSYPEAIAGVIKCYYSPTSRGMQWTMLVLSFSYHILSPRLLLNNVKTVGIVRAKLISLQLQ